MATILSSALEYLGMGFSVIPIMPRGKLPQANVLPGYGESKASWEQFQHTPPSDITVMEWFADRPRLNLAIVTGKVSNLVVIDVDNEQGLEQYRLWHGGHGVKTTWVHTGKGFHFYFNYPDGVEIRNRTHWREGIDIRADGGYVLAPPSIHPSGRQYTWGRSETAPHIDERADLPSQLLDLLVDTKHERPAFKPVQPTLGSPLSRFLFNSFMHELAKAPQGDRNNVLNVVAWKLARIVAAGALLESECRDAVRNQALAIGLDEGEIERTIESAFRSGLALPWQFHEGRRTR